MKLKWLRIDAGFKELEDIAEYFEVNIKTAKKWEKENTPPRAVFLCLKLMAGQLDVLGKEWKGFRLTRGAIENPEGDFIYGHEIKAIRYVYQAAGIERSRICRMLKNQQPIRSRLKDKAREKNKKEENKHFKINTN